MTRKLFWDDTYAKEFDAEVELVEGNRVVLDQTAFNPRGGGLVSDTGRINGMRVIEAMKEGDSVFHMLETPAELRVGDRVHGVLDWDRRYRIMKMHTSAHILSSVVNRETGALITGNQISPDESRVDFNLEDFSKDRIADYVGKANEAIARGLEVKAFFMKREEALAQPGFVKLANAMPPSMFLSCIFHFW